MWFKVCDGFSEHPKAIAAGNEACGVWSRMGSWSSQYCTGGVVPHAKALAIAGELAPLTALLKAGLLERLNEDGAPWVFHDWSDYNPTADEAKAYRKKKSNAGKLGAAKRWANHSSAKASDTTPAKAGAMPSVMAKGTGTGTGTGSLNKAVPDPIELVWGLFNAARLRRYPDSRRTKLNATRRGHIKQRLGDVGQERIMSAIDKYFDQRYYWAKGDEAKRPELLFRSLDQFEKVENASAWDNGSSRKTGQFHQPDTRGPQEVLSQIADRRTDEQTKDPQ